jgi:hypothetical protein
MVDERLAIQAQTQRRDQGSPAIAKTKGSWWRQDAGCQRGRSTVSIWLSAGSVAPGPIVGNFVKRPVLG